MNEVTKYAELADQYITKRKARLALQRQVDELDKEEKKLKAELINGLKASEGCAIGGKLVTVTLKTKQVATATDWALVYKYIQENDAWDLIQKRLTQSAVDLRWEDKVVIPGIQPFPVDDLSISER